MANDTTHCKRINEPRPVIRDDGARPHNAKVGKVYATNIAINLESSDTRTHLPPEDLKGNSRPGICLGAPTPDMELRSYLPNESAIPIN